MKRHLVRGLAALALIGLLSSQANAFAWWDNITPIIPEAQAITPPEKPVLLFNVAATTPGGTNTQIQFNNSGAFGGTSGETCTSTICTLVGGTLSGTTTLPGGGSISSAGLIKSGLAGSDVVAYNGGFTNYGLGFTGNGFPEIFVNNVRVSYLGPTIEVAANSPYAWPAQQQVPQGYTQYGGVDVATNAADTSIIRIAPGIVQSIVGAIGQPSVAGTTASTPAGSAQASFTASMGASFTGTGSGTNLTTTAVTGVITPGDAISGTGVPGGTAIVSQTSGVTGGAGVYVTNNATTSSGASITSTSPVLVVSAVAQGVINNLHQLFGTSVPAGTVITARFSGTTGNTGSYYTNSAANIASEPMTTVAQVAETQASWVHSQGGLASPTAFNAAATTTLANVTGLSTTLTPGARYRFAAYLPVTADGTGGQKYTLTGTATANNFISDTQIIDETTGLSTLSRQTSLTTAAALAGNTNTAFKTTIDGTIIANAGGTFGVQFAQNSASGTSTVGAGASLMINELPSITAIAFTGDSITAGNHTTNNTTGVCLGYFTVLGMPGAFYGNTNWGLPSAVLGFSGDANPLSLYTQAAALDATLPVAPNVGVLNVLIGANDFPAGTSTGTFLTRLATYLDARRVTGWKVVIDTLLPETAVGFNAWRNTVNATVATWSGVHADAVADLAANAQIGPDGAAANLKYFQSDGTHLQLQGCAIAASVIIPQVASLTK